MCSKGKRNIDYSKRTRKEAALIKIINFARIMEGAVQDEMRKFWSKYKAGRNFCLMPAGSKRTNHSGPQHLTI